jgi:predicted MFS family arabinose efflux permease
MNRRTYSIIAAGALIIILSMGIRSGFGLFLVPITETLGIGRESFSLAMAIQNIVLGIPLAGILADRFGPRTVAVTGGVLYAIGMYAISNVSQVGGLYLWLGVVLGIAQSGTTYVVILGAIAQIVPPEKRSLSFGVITAAGSFGMFSMIPFSQTLETSFGWQSTFAILSGCMMLIVVLALILPTRHSSPQDIQDPITESLTKVLLRASQHRGYLLLVSGFFVCGFHVAFISSHLPAYLTDGGVAPEARAASLAFIGLANIAGSFTFGYLGDRYRKKHLLSGLYLSRAIIISLFLILPLTNGTAIIFGMMIGFVWLATVPLTSGTIAQIFGVRYLATLYGFVFFSHQIGSFLGVWLGGRFYDQTGSYSVIWIAAIILSFFAFLVHLPIPDRPISLPSAAVSGGD